MPKEKIAGVEILKDGHFQMTNPWKKPVVGWQPTSQGVGGLYNPMGFAALRVVNTKLVDGVMVPLYDQPLIVENLGSIVIAQLGDRVGLVKNFRMIGERLLPDAGAEYIRRLESEKRWEELLSTLGQWSWEAPRGLAPGKGEEDMKSFILKTAKIEAAEEAGFKIEDARIAGRVNVNTTFFPHAQYVVHARIDSIGKAKPEELELLGATRLFTMRELRELNDAGEFVDGLTLAALALCGLGI